MKEMAIKNIEIAYKKIENTINRFVEEINENNQNAFHYTYFISKKDLTQTLSSNAWHPIVYFIINKRDFSNKIVANYRYYALQQGDRIFVNLDDMNSGKLPTQQSFEV